jgi:hypothetical protein
MGSDTVQRAASDLDGSLAGRCRRLQQQLRAAAEGKEQAIEVRLVRGTCYERRHEHLRRCRISVPANLPTDALTDCVRSVTVCVDRKSTVVRGHNSRSI